MKIGRYFGSNFPKYLRRAAIFPETIDLGQFRAPASAFCRCGLTAWPFGNIGVAVRAQWQRRSATSARGLWRGRPPPVARRELRQAASPPSPRLCGMAGKRRFLPRRVSISGHIKARKARKKPRRRKNAPHNFAITNKSHNFVVYNCEKQGSVKPAREETFKNGVCPVGLRGKCRRGAP